MDIISLKQSCPMKSLGNILKVAREEKEMILRKVSAEVDIDQSLISKFEKNERKPTKEQLIRLAKFYNLSEQQLIINWYSEKIAEDLKYTQGTTEILRVAEEKINYYKSQENKKLISSEILSKLKIKPVVGLQLTKRKGLLNSTWIIYLKNGFYYFFDISEKITFDKKHRYSKEQFIKDYENSYFEIDCECF